MSFKVIHQDEPLTVESIVVLLFGDPGTGKSSLAFTSKNPVCLDFDRGLQRAVGRKMSVRFETWAEALEFIDSPFIKENKIDSLIIDTGGTMLDDYIAHHILGMGVKGVDNGAGGLGLRGYGVMKDSFGRFSVACKHHKVDVIIVCHSKKEDDGDAKRFYPQMTGGSLDILTQKADLSGYMEMQGSEITLDFNPTTRHTGKNCARFEKFILPHFEKPEYADFMARIIEATKKFMQRQNESQVAAIKLVDDYKTKLANVDSLESLETFKEGIEALSPIYRAQVHQFYNNQYAKLWSLENVVEDELQIPEDFAKLSEKIKALPKTIASELQEPFRALLEKAGLAYDKVKPPCSKDSDKEGCS